MSDDDRTIHINVDVDQSPAGRAGNDQIAAAANVDLDEHLAGLRRSWNNQPDGNPDPVDFLAGWSMALIEAEDAMPRERLASLLAVAMLRLLNPESAHDTWPSHDR